MSLRGFLALSGGLLLLAGLIVALFVPVSASDSAGVELRCGTGAFEDEIAARDYDQRRHARELEGALDATTGLPTGPGYGTPLGGSTVITPADCDGARSSRLMLGVPIAVVGAVVLLGALIVRTPPGRMRREES